MSEYDRLRAQMDEMEARQNAEHRRQGREGEVMREEDHVVDAYDEWEAEIRKDVAAAERERLVKLAESECAENGDGTRGVRKPGEDAFNYQKRVYLAEKAADWLRSHLEE